MRRRFLVLVAGALTAAALAGPVQAAPRGDPFEVKCDSGGSIQVVVAGRGLWGPALNSDGLGVFTPYRHHQTVTYDPDDGDPFLLESVDVQRNSPPGNLIVAKGDRCAFEAGGLVTQEMADALGLPGPGTWRLDGIVWGLWVK
jgi:hypothetical protein